MQVGSLTHPALLVGTEHAKRVTVVAPFNLGEICVKHSSGGLLGCGKQEDWEKNSLTYGIVRMHCALINLSVPQARAAI